MDEKQRLEKMAFKIPTDAKKEISMGLQIKKSDDDIGFEPVNS